MAPATRHTSSGGPPLTLLDTRPSAPPTLRFYQRDCIDRTVADLDAGAHLNCLDVLPTGAGKTNTLLELFHEDCLSRGGRALLIAHRRELIHQPYARMLDLHPEYGADVGVVMADRDDAHARLVIATVQTLQSRQRVERLLRFGDFTHLATDEAHHSVSGMYTALTGYLRERNPALRHVGFTATPIRSDGDGLRKVFSTTSYKVSIKEMIAWGFLVPIEGFAVMTEVAVQGVQVDRASGEYKQSQLAKVFDVDNWSELVVRTHLERAAGKRFIAFTAGVKHAYHLAKRFRDAGLDVVGVDGSTPKPVRDGILRRMRAGDLDGICNCDVFTEGLDLPMLEVCHMVAPNKSALRYIQKVGRILRPWPGKDAALVFDYVPVDDPNIVMAGDVLGKSRERRRRESQAAAAGLIVPGVTDTGDGEPDELDLGPGTGRVGDALFLNPMAHLSSSPFRWYLDGGMASLNLGSNDDGVVSRILVISRPAPSDGRHRLALIEQKKGHRDPTVTTLAAAAPDDYGSLVARGTAMAEESGVPELAGGAMPWHQRRCSAFQLNALIRLERWIDSPEGGDRTALHDRLQRLTQREAGQLITHALARKALAAFAERLRSQVA